VRTTLTLDQDVAQRIKQTARRSGLPFKVVVNELLRSALSQRQEASVVAPFVAEPHHFGGLRPGVSLDNISDLLENLDGPDHR
jgi:hypothetical protein